MVFISLSPHTRPIPTPSSHTAVAAAAIQHIHWLSLDDNDDIQIATTVSNPEPESDEAAPVSPFLNPIKLPASSSRIVHAVKTKYIHCTSLFYHDDSDKEAAVDDDEGYSTATTAPSPTDSFASSSKTLTSADDKTAIPAHKRRLPTDSNALFTYLIAFHRRGIVEQEARCVRAVQAPTAAEERLRRLEAVRWEAEAEGARRMREAREKVLKKREGELGLTVGLLEGGARETEVGGPRNKRLYDDDEVEMIEDPAMPAQTMLRTHTMDLEFDEAKPQIGQTKPEARSSADGQLEAQQSARDISSPASASVSNGFNSVVAGRLDHIHNCQPDAHEFDIDVGAKRLSKIEKHSTKAKVGQVPRARWVAGFDAGEDGDEVQPRRTTGGKRLGICCVAARGDEDGNQVQPQPRRTTGGKGLTFSRATVTAAAVGPEASLNPPGGLEMLRRKRRKERGEVGEDNGDHRDADGDVQDEIPARRRALQAAASQNLAHGILRSDINTYEMAKRRQRDLSALGETIRATGALVAATGNYTTVMESEIEELRAFADIMLGKRQHGSVLPPRIGEIRANMRRRDKKYLGKGIDAVEGKNADMRKIASGWWDELKIELEKAKAEVERLRSLKYRVQGAKGWSGRNRWGEYRRFKDREVGRTPAARDRTATTAPTENPPSKMSHSRLEDLPEDEHESSQEARPLVATLMGPRRAEAAVDFLSDPEDVEVDAATDASSDNESVVSSSSCETPAMRYTIQVRFANMEAFGLTTGTKYAFPVKLGSSSREADKRREELEWMWGEIYAAKFAAGMEVDSETHISKRDGMVVREVEMGDAGWKVWVEAEELLVDGAESESEDEAGGAPQRVYAVHSQRRITRNGATFNDAPSVEVEEDPFAVRQFTSSTQANDDAMGLMVQWYGGRFEAGYVKMAEREMEEGLRRESLFRWEGEVVKGAEREHMHVFVVEALNVELDDDDG